MATSVSRLFEFKGYEWDDEKNRKNIEKHGIDFEQVPEIFEGIFLLYPSSRNDEERWLAIGETEGHLIAVAFTPRGDRLRIISARRARKNEKHAYRQEKMGRTAKRQD